MGKLFVLINGILNNDRLHMINFIYSFGQALTQFLFPFLLQLVTRWICFNCSLILIGAMILHIIPITMLVMKDKILIKLRQKKLGNTADVVSVNDESRYSDISAISFDFGADIKYPSDLFDMDSKWKNPSSFDRAAFDPKGDNFLQELESHRIMNSEGVEILQTILETEEEPEIKFEQIIIGDNELTDDAIESIYEEINRKHEQHKQQRVKKPSRCYLISSSIAIKYRRLSTSAYRQIFNPLRRSLKIFKFYPSVILKSCDIFSYLLFITVILPNLALKQYQLEDSDKIIYLITLMGLCWIIYALLVLRHHSLLKQSFIQYFHIVGLLGKFFGYLCAFICRLLNLETKDFTFSHKPKILDEQLRVWPRTNQLGTRKLASPPRNHDPQLLSPSEVVLRSRINLQLQWFSCINLLLNVSRSARDFNIRDLL